jgi:hypothetical protein
VLCGDWSAHDDVCEVDGVQGPSSTWLGEVKIMIFPAFIRAGCGLLTQVFVCETAKILPSTGKYKEKTIVTTLACVST